MILVDKLKLPLRTQRNATRKGRRNVAFLSIVAVEKLIIATNKKHTMTENEIAKVVLDCAFKVHRELGPGLLESAYQKCLAYELRQEGLKVEEEKGLPLIYKEIKMECGYRLDLWIEDKFLVELKAVDELAPIHLAQVITYLKISNTKLGLLLNFDVALLKHGIKRVVNNF